MPRACHQPSARFSRDRERKSCQERHLCNLKGNGKDRLFFKLWQEPNIYYLWLIFFKNRIVICIVFIFIAIVTVIVIFSMFMFIFVTIIKLLLGFFQDLNRRQSSPSHLRAIQTPKTWHPRLRTAPLTPHSISAGGTGRGGCSFGDVGPGAAVG